MFESLLERFRNHALKGEIEQALEESEQTLDSLRQFDSQYQQNPQAYSDPQIQSVLTQMKLGIQQLLDLHTQLQNGSIDVEDHEAVRSALSQTQQLCQSLNHDLSVVQQTAGQSAPQAQPGQQQSTQPTSGGSSGGGGMFGDLMLASMFGMGGGMLGDALMGGMMGGSGSGSNGSSGNGSGSGGSGSGSGASGSGGSGGSGGGSS